VDVMVNQKIQSELVAELKNCLAFITNPIINIFAWLKKREKSVYWVLFVNVHYDYFDNEVFK